MASLLEPLCQLCPGEETSVPLFFALESTDLTSVFNEISVSNAVGSEKAATALQVINQLLVLYCAVYIVSPSRRRPMLGWDFSMHGDFDLDIKAGISSFVSCVKA